MFHIGFTPNAYPANALSAKHETLMGAIAQLFNDLGLAYGPEEWFVARILEASKEATDNMENGDEASGSWSDMGSEDDAFSIDIFNADDVRIVTLDGDELLAPHGAVALAIGEFNHQEWIYDEDEVSQWDNVLRPAKPSIDWKGLDAAVELAIETCEHTGMTRDELESICGRAEPIIEAIARDVKQGDCTLIGFFSDNAERKLFSFYVDELTFDDAELIGKTETEAHHLHQQKTVAYLQA